MNYLKGNKLKLGSIIKHDTVIHSVGFNPTEYQLSLDFDWIIKTDIQSGIYEYHLSPSTLIFENVWDFQLNLESNLSITIDEFKILSKSKPKNIDYLCNVQHEYLVLLDCFEGAIQFRTIGGKLFKRKPCCINMNASLSIKDRGGFSLLPNGEEFNVIVG